MKPDDVAKYKSLYIQTATDYLHKLQNGIELLLKNQQTADTVRELFIAAHSLAGQSAVIGYTQLAEAASLLEKSFKSHIDGKTDLTQESLQQLANLVQKMLQSIDVIEKEGEETDLGNLESYKKF